MAFRIVVGIPSWNESDSIAKVAGDIDSALTHLPFAHEALLVNADNTSTDGTPEVFMSAETRHEKRVITTAPRAGKGTNWRAILEVANDERADALLFVDSDLAEVPAEWVHTLLEGVREDLDFCYPLRPPTWNGGDLTYQLAYPLLTCTFGADLREPLCGDIAISATAVRDLLSEAWQPAEMRFGVDFLAAGVAAKRRWGTRPLSTRRWNKLRSFRATTGGDYRMGAKFSEVSAAVGYRCAMRLQRPPPTALITSAAANWDGDGFTVPENDPDVAQLAVSSCRRLRDDAARGAFEVFSADLAKELTAHATSSGVQRGVGWNLWRRCLFEWISGIAAHRRPIDGELLETLFLSRVVGHHGEIAGRSGWYRTVIDQAADAYSRRHELWGATVGS